MAAIGAYTNPAWVNGTAPAINTTNLQLLTDQVKNITDAAVSGGAAPTKIWTSTNDDNGGQPPAPKAKTYVAGLTPGELTYLALDNGATWTNPGGTWAASYIIFDRITKVMYSYNTINTSGNIIGTAGYIYVGWLWRMS
jgi:hypothetical protein